MPTKIIMPQLGESVVEGTITRWLKQEGETVSEMDSLLEVNTDKVDTEIPSPAGGTLLKILAPEGETVRAGTIIAWVGQPGEAIPGDAGPGGGAAKQPAAGAPAQALQESAVDPAIAGPTTGDAAAREAAAATQAAPAARHSGNGQPDHAAAAASPAVSSPPADPSPQVPTPQPGRSRELGFISPIVARMAQENQVDLSQVKGSGEGGRITKKDVLAYLEQRPAGQTQVEEAAGIQEAAPWETPGEGDLFRPTEMVFARNQPAGRTEPVRPAPQAQPQRPPESAARTVSAQPQLAQQELGPLPGEDQVLPLSTMRRKIAEHMVVSKRTSPHVTTVMEADLHRVIAHYNANKQTFSRQGARLTYTAYFVAAAVEALRAFPLVNASWTDEGIAIHPQINIGMAVSLGEEGLIVPVLKQASELSLLGLSRSIGDLANRAREHRLQPDDVKDATFTITNHGISGSLFATPIINQPQCGILGVGAIQKRVVVLEDEAGGDTIAIRPMAYLSLTFDHRILDGASADGFLGKVVQVLENWT